MRYIMGILCLIVGLCLIFGIKTIDIDSISSTFGTVFILLANLIVKDKGD